VSYCSVGYYYHAISSAEDTLGWDRIYRSKGLV